MVQFKYESLLGGLNNLVERGDSFTVYQTKPLPDYIALWKAIEEQKRALLFSKPKIEGPELEPGEVYETISWRVERIA